MSPATGLRAATREEIAAAVARVLFEWGAENEIEVSENAEASRGEDAGGVWVQAWVWVADDDDDDEG